MEKYKSSYWASRFARQLGEDSALDSGTTSSPSSQQSDTRHSGSDCWTPILLPQASWGFPADCPCSSSIPATTRLPQLQVRESNCPLAWDKTKRLCLPSKTVLSLGLAQPHCGLEAGGTVNSSDSSCRGLYIIKGFYMRCHYMCFSQHPCEASIYNPVL